MNRRIMTGPRCFAMLVLLVLLSPLQASDESELSALLGEFLAGASVNDAAVHERFWADELVYTSSAGLRFGKAEIMAGLAASEEPEEAPMRYSADDIRIQLYGDTAVVAFKLLGTPEQHAGPVQQFFNTGTFRKRDGEWRAVAWQATRIPE